MFYFLNREDMESVGLACKIDPEYAVAFEKAVKAGVEILAYQVKLTPKEIVLKKRVSFVRRFH